MGQEGPLVLVVEDERPMRRFLKTALVAHGYRVHECETGEDALTQASTRGPDVVLLDLGLPDTDGVDVTRRLREWSSVPVVVVSARGREQDKIDALDAGADDYLTKPFGVGELLARLRVALRHAERREGGTHGAESTFTVERLHVDLGRRRVLLDGVEIHLTPIEYKLLATLVKHAGRVLTHRQLLREVWGPPYAEQTQYLRVYMGQLRHKLEADTTRPRFLLTEPGVGYRLRSD